MPEGLKPHVPPDKGFFTTGSLLRNARWDSTGSVLRDVAFNDSRENKDSLPMIWVKPKLVADSGSPNVKSNLYNCPLYGARHSFNQSDSNIVWFIPLPTVDSVTLWAQKRTCMILAPVTQADN